MSSLSRHFLLWILLALLTACGGSSGGGAQGQPGSGDGGGDGDAGAPINEPDVFFEQRLQSSMDFCRTCHIPGGVADSDDGRRFILSSNAAEDYSLLHAAWQALGGGTDTSLLLVEASDPGEPHSGGKPWTPDGRVYRDMQRLLNCWNAPESCTFGDGEAPDEPDLQPLLGSARGGHYWFDYCADDGSGSARPDSAVLPADPRALVQPGVSDNKAVHFNTFWADCHADVELVGEYPHPQTCGELRASWERGRALMMGSGEASAGTFFNADYHDPDALLALDASSYNQVWRQWGLLSRPENFDQLVAERYGMPVGEARNPYPLPGEDPNVTDGGSGQLPLFLTQMRGPNGEWSGTLGYTCHACHTGAAGLPGEGRDTGVQLGGGNSLHDIALMAKELGIAAASGLNGQGLGTMFSLFGTSRGTNNASDVNIFFLLNKGSGPSLDEHLFGMITSGSTASGDTPAWWNMGRRPVKFQDGFFPMDASRVDLIFYTPFETLLGDETGEQWVRDHAQDADKWMMSLRSPEYPLPINTALAEQGAVLFHSKDLWAEQLNNPVPRPEGGNGSCASCHGAYSPRYVHDSTFLADPSMEGVAANIAPKSVIRTDPARVDTNNESVNQYGADSFLGFGETVGTEHDCGPLNRESIRGGRPMGYLAPPLYGVWATAPYLHNGAVPNVWGLLKPDDRPALWRRQSAPAPAGQQGQVVMGFDVSMARAYDPEKLGWKYEELSCGDGTVPLLECSLNGDSSPVFQDLLAQLYGNLIASWNLGQLPTFLQITPDQVENRKIYNTHLYSQGNEGHDFTVVLTDAERRAIIEYLKTL